VLAGEVIDVRELEGGRAHVEYPLLVAELAAVGISESDLVVELDAQTGAETAVWVPWQSRPNLGFSGPGDRHYTIERTHGRVEFGDGVHGLVPVVARDNIRARQYQSSQAGTAGNVPAGAITQVTSGLLVSGVTNPRAAEGGAASESDDLVLARGPLTVRNRRQAVTAGDYEALAFEASPAVAVARAATARGTVTVTVVPQSPDPQPEPSWELRREVEEFLRPRMPAAAGSLSIVPPKYFEVGVSAVVVPRVVDQGGVVVAATRAALAQFLHPLTGGPGGNGWPFGRSVYLSDVAALVEGLEGVDHAAELSLLVAGAPAGEVVAVPADRLVAAGFLDVTLGGTS
jgi:predicted phage baseplate assembly protein